ncbi:MAG: hypothetical protein ACYDH0_01710 [Candidatus Aminicenantales bacterium]
MQKITAPMLVLAAALLPAGIVRGAVPEKSLFQGVTARIGLDAGVLSRTIRWDDGAQQSRMKAFSLALTGDFEFPFGLDLGVFAGLSLSDFKGMLFENLPISIEYQPGTASGILLGGEARKSLFVSGDFETGAAVRFVTSIGMKKTWPIEGFAVAGETSGKPNWSQISVGPRVSYKGFERFVPYAGLSLSWLWGDFELAETMGDLEGTELKKIKQKNILRISLGGDYALNSRIRVRGEAGWLPGSGGGDWSASIGLLSAF